MSAGGIPTQPQSSAAAGASRATLRLAAGQELDARIIKDLGDGKYELQTDSGRLTVSSQTPLREGETVSLQIAESGGRLVLNAVYDSGDSTAAAATLTAVDAADTATVSLPVLLTAELPEVAEQLAAVPEGGQLAAGLAVTENQAAIHFADGTVLETAVYSGAAQGQLSVLTELALETLGTAVALSDAASASGSPLLLESALVRAELPFSLVAAELETASGETESSMAPERIATGRLETRIEFSLRSAAVIGELQANAGDGALGLEVTAYDAETGAATLAAGGKTLQAQFAAELPLPKGAMLRVSAGETALLAGEVKTSLAATAQGETTIDGAIRAAGLEPSQVSRAAAAALLEEGAAVNAENLKALAFLASGREEGEMSAMLRAGARLVAREIPVALPVAAGMAQILGGEGQVYENLDRAAALVNSALPQETEAPAAATLRAAAAAIGETAVLLDGQEAAENLERFAASLAREPLASAASLVEQAAGEIVSASPELAKLDFAISALTAALRQAGAGTLSAESIAGILAQAAQTEAETAASLPAHPGVMADDAGREQSGAREAVPVWADGAMREILSSRDQAQLTDAMQKLLGQHDSKGLSGLLSRLEETERDLLSRDQSLNRLSEAARELNDAGRRFLAYKADNLASLRQEPAIFVTEAPFRLAGEPGGGRMQVFFRRGSRQDQGKWSARVLLDLHTTQLGPVVGDLRFVGKEISLTFYAADAEARDNLSADRAELVGALRDKGFRCSPRFRLILDHAPEAAAEGESAPETRGGARGRGGLDIQV